MEQSPGIDNLIKNTVLEEGLALPSDNFTDKVMGAVMETNRPATVYKPLIPKYILAAIASLLFLIILVFSMSGYRLQPAKIPWLNKIAGGLKLPHFSLFIPEQISYILASALVMVLIQVFVIGALYKRMYR